jgi:hypothetical protein
MAIQNGMSLLPGLLWLILNLALIIQCLSRNNIFFIFQFYITRKMFRVPLRSLQVEDHCQREHAVVREGKRERYHKYFLEILMKI